MYMGREGNQMVRVKHPITNEIMSVRGAESFWAVDPGSGKKSKYLIADYRLDGKGTPFVAPPKVDPPAEKPAKEPAEPAEKIVEKPPVVKPPVEKPPAEAPPAIEMPPAEKPPKEKPVAKGKIVKTGGKQSPQRPWYKEDWFF